jgi:hypothetical protein
MEKQSAGLAAGMGDQDFATELAEVFEPWAEIGGELVVDFATKALGYGRALASGGDGDLEIAAADYGAEEEIAVGDVVDAVGENAATHGFAINSGVHFRDIGGCDDEGVAVEVGGFKSALEPFEFAFAG